MVELDYLQIILQQSRQGGEFMLKNSERTQDLIEYQKRLQDMFGIELHVAMPGIVQSVDYNKQTCTVQPAIRARLNYEGTPTWVDLPLLLDVPFFIPSGGGYSITFPIKPGDDCLVIFGDNCMDAWWQSGGIQNQVERRYHDLSDGFALIGFKSQPQRINNYSASSVQIRNNEGSAYIELSGNTINIVGNVNIKGGNTTIDGKIFLGHTHSGIMPGGSNTGGVS